ncbi:MAG: hemolysin family protein [Aerococcus sp.]|nr:hemolysin family protein [Aerococcus sp.]
MEDPGATSIGGQILLIIVLTLVNAYLAGAEMAFVSVDQGKIKELVEEGNKKAENVEYLLGRSDHFLSTIQVGITFAGFLSSASAANTFVGYISPYLANIPVGDMIATVLVTVILSYVSLVFGELFPKQVAIQFPEDYCLATAGSIRFLMRVFTPFVWLLTASTNLLKRLVPIDFTVREEHLTRREMGKIIESGRNEGAIDLDEFRMMQGVLNLDSKLGKEVMVPRTDTMMLDIEDDVVESLEEMLAAPYSRFPIYRDDKDDVIGIIHAKDVLRETERVGFENVKMENIMKPAYFAPETIYIDDLLLQFKRNNQHMAILKDEYGGVVGIVTLEDLLEEIVGDIEDEYDEETADYQKIDDKTYLINGSMSISDFNPMFDTEIESEESDTIAGYVIEILGHFPADHVQESVRIEDYLLTTTEVENGRIRELEVYHSPLSEDESSIDEG